jgi:hypothetical protein
MNIKFSRIFQKKNSQEGAPTNFVEKILNHLKIDYRKHEYLVLLNKLNRHNTKLTFTDIVNFYHSLDHEENRTKSTTIRPLLHTLKKSGKYDLAVWKSKPYTETQIIFAPPVELIVSLIYSHEILQNLAFISERDGLSVLELREWLELDKNIMYSYCALNNG